MKKYRIKITFLPDPKTKKPCPIKYMNLVTKLVTEKRANEIAEHNADSIWFWWKYTIKGINL